jgi:type I restriction enzyme S subunit
VSGKWPIKTIAECAAPEPYSTQIGPFGKALTPEEYTASGVPLLRGVNVNHGRFHDDDFVFISEETAARFTKYESHPGDVLLVHKGTLGEIGLMPKARKFPKYIMGNSMLRVKCDPDVLLPEYLYYWLTSADGQHYLFSRVSQVGVPQIQTPLKTLREAALPVPPLPVQRRITAILGTLDEKIELNQRMNETLEATARTLFRSWFVDFDPVRARADDTKPQGINGETAALFPDGFEDSPLGKVPKGWRVESIGKLVDVVGGSTPSTDEPSYWNGEYNFATPKDLASLTSPVLLTTERTITAAGLERISSGLLPAGVVLMSSRAPIGYLAISEIPVAVNQGFIAMRCADAMPNYYVLQWARENMDEIIAHANGTTFLEISKTNFRPLKALVPAEPVLQAYSAAVTPLYRRIVSNLEESRTLAAMRDALLPKLLSGEVRVTADE